MDERQRVVLKTFTKEELLKMSVEDLVTLVGEAGPGAKLHGTGVIRKKDGTIRYDKEATPGNFGESQDDLDKIAKDASDD